MEGVCCGFSVAPGAVRVEAFGLRGRTERPFSDALEVVGRKDLLEVVLLSGTILPEEALRAAGGRKAGWVA